MTERRRAYQRGRGAEFICALMLRLKGWHVVARRYRTPVGEIDIVAKRRSTLVFVEIKARSTVRRALESITAQQRARIERAAAAFLSRHPKWSNLALRFDVMVVTPRRLPRHIVDAWRPHWK